MFLVTWKKTARCFVWKLNNDRSIIRKTLVLYLGRYLISSLYIHVYKHMIAQKK